MAQFSESISTLVQALHAFQEEVVPVVKDAINPFFDSRYATLNAVWNAIQPILLKHNLVVISLPDGNGLTTVVSHTCGEFITVCAELADIGNPQKQGGSITYMRRYTLAGLGIVIDEDDDANEATEAAKKTAKAKAKKPVERKLTGEKPKWNKK
jgi:hypothetical protein